MKYIEYRKDPSLRVKLITWLTISSQAILPIASPLSIAEASHHQETFWGEKAEKPLPDSDGLEAVAGFALGSATDAINNRVQHWLSRYGNARVQLDVDTSFSLKNSQLDLLIPLYEQQNSLVFVQNSLHRTDGRIQSNLGLGLRWFDDDDSMVGGNMFADYDWSQRHVRAGAGVEYGRDFLKLSANGYRRLTDWKEANNLVDYQSRPANGWDVRAETWLPAWPQLGGKLKYEQYYGHQVAQHNREDRQKDPRTFSVGMNYTPIPLLTLSGEQQFSDAGKSDTRFGLQLNYQLGVPWREQINPDVVSAMRTLIGTRYDLVERNNNLVLEYQKKETIHLTARSPVTGEGGEQKVVDFSIKSTNVVDHIEWSAPELEQAGGKINCTDEHSCSVTLPSYQSSTPHNNTYTILWTAVDKKGNRSHPSQTQVTVVHAAIDVDKSRIEPSDITLHVGDPKPQTMTLTLKDYQGQLVDIAEKNITHSAQSKSTLISAFKRQTPGVYSATLTAGTYKESFTLTVSAGETKLMPIRVNVNGNAATAKIEMTPTSGDKVANGQEQHTIDIKVIDARGNPLRHQYINLKADNPALIENRVKTDYDGKATVSVTNTQAGSSTVTADIDGKGQQTVTVNFIADKTTARIKSLKLMSDKAMVADGNEINTVRAVVADKQGNPLENHTIYFDRGDLVPKFPNQVKTDKNGEVAVPIATTVAGSYDIIGSVSEDFNGGKSVTLKFIGDKKTARIERPDFFVEDTDDNNKKRAWLIVKDVHNNRVPDAIVTFEASDNETQIDKKVINTGDNGTAETIITRPPPHPGTVNITANVNGTSQSHWVHF